MLMAAGILVVVVGSAVFWLRGGRYASTDDAYVQAAKLVVTTDVSGLVASVNVHEQQRSNAGRPAVPLDPLPFQIALDNATANLAANRAYDRIDEGRLRRMLSNVDAQRGAGRSSIRSPMIAMRRSLKTTTSHGALYDQARFTCSSTRTSSSRCSRQAKVQLAKLAGNPDIAAADHPLYQQAKAQVDEAQRQLDTRIGARAIFAASSRKSMHCSPARTWYRRPPR